MSGSSRPIFLQSLPKRLIIEKKIVHGRPIPLLLSGAAAGALVPLVPLAFLVLNLLISLLDFYVSSRSSIFANALTYLKSAAPFIPISAVLGVLAMAVKRYSLEKKKYIQISLMAGPAMSGYTGPSWMGSGGLQPVKITADFLAMSLLVPAVLLIYDTYLWSGALSLVIACSGMLYSIFWEIINDWLLDFVPFNLPRLLHEIIIDSIYRDPQIYRIPRDLSVEVSDDLTVTVSGTAENKYEKEAIVAACRKVRGVSRVQDGGLRIRTA